MTETLTEMLIIFIKIVCALIWFLLLTLYLTWLERKESALIQDRLGANRAPIFGIRIIGLFQPFADAIKMIFKEDFVPSFSRKFLHTIAPFISFFFVAITIAAIPFGDILRIGDRTINLQILDFNVGLLFVLAMLSLGIYGIIISGWASNNRYTLTGGLRGAAQVISYEVALGLSLIGLIMVYPSLRLSSIVLYQGELLFGFLPKWGIFLQPLGFTGLQHPVRRTRNRQGIPGAQTEIRSWRQRRPASRDLNDVQIVALTELCFRQSLSLKW